MMRTMRSRPSRAGSEAGTTVVEIVLCVAILAVATLAASMATQAAARRMEYAKELEIAKLAVRRARENLGAVKFRGSDATDTSEWLFRGGYEIARNADGSSFLMPDVRSVGRQSVNGLDGWVVVAFPVPPLSPVGGTHAGRIELHTNESTQPATIPEARFPFPPTPGFARLDCDGDGAFTTTDLRSRHTLSTAPCRLIPARVVVEWRSAMRMEARYEEWFLLSFQGLQ